MRLTYVAAFVVYEINHSYALSFDFCSIETDARHPHMLGYIRINILGALLPTKMIEATNILLAALEAAIRQTTTFRMSIAPCQTQSSCADKLILSTSWCSSISRYQKYSYKQAYHQSSS